MDAGVAPKSDDWSVDQSKLSETESEWFVKTPERAKATEGQVHLAFEIENHTTRTRTRDLVDL